MTDADIEYLLFDIDEDDAPELCMRRRVYPQFVYVFKYDAKSDEFTAWKAENSGWVDILGSEKMVWFNPHGFLFSQLDQNGDTIFSVWFYEHNYYDVKESYCANYIFMLGW